MALRTLIGIGLIAVGLAGSPPSATAQPAAHERGDGPPACTAANAGQRQQQADVQCACRSFAESALRGTPAGYRWDCGILRARANHQVPATSNPYPHPLPGALSVDRTLIVPPRRGH